MAHIPADRCKVPPAFWQAVQALGVSPPVLLRQARLPAALHLSGQMLNTTQYFALMRALEELVAMPGVGIQMMEKTATSVHPPSTLSAFYARDYRDGLGRLARFKRLCTPKALVMSEADGLCSVSVHWLYASEPEPDISVDISFALLVELGRRCIGPGFKPLRVELTRPMPQDDIYAAYFDAPVRYAASADVLIFDGSDLDRPFSGHNPELLSMLEPALGSALRELDVHGVVSEQVVALLKRGLPSGRPNVGEIARQLGMSERTLQRRITLENTSFRDLLAQARREMARRYLADHAVPVDEVSYLLGFQDLTSFQRAFREWEGCSPSDWRSTQ
ncbi:helix-turn-helix domain-containing protein [Pseudoduganella sp. FT55W]|uniref:Helix-turn-helix domain-containing protein n=1 Tax=Duganella rivi TaxID=2666083 RepID=A0A7X4KDM8_9BURK|nr:AraC family transcriptional regulator [Duganella rivi]MYM68603.1 helix-turn-helix domain-containing protein [Duganella rivi]